MEKVFKKEDVEVLISTMNRDSLDFLLPMFPFGSFSDFNILIINQTQENTFLTSNHPNVRVINTLERGLSKSRNLALKNAKGKIALIADDDVVFAKDFTESIAEAFNSQQNLSVITFNHQRFGEDLPKRASTKEYMHDTKSIFGEVCSIEIAFLPEIIKKYNISFDENYGLGAEFGTAEEFLFLRSILKSGLNIIYNPQVVVSHPLLTSGEDEGSDKLIYARSALFYKTKGIFVYLWLLKYLFFLFRKKHIKPEALVEKWKVGIAGIRKYREIVRLITSHGDQYHTSIDPETHKK